MRARPGASNAAGADARAGTGVALAPYVDAYAPGQVISRRFLIERLIGRGSMGVVLAARHLELGTCVAIKAVLPEMQGVPGVLALFAREAKAAVSIRSEHVAQVFDVGTDDAIGPYIVMEYLDGRDLRAVLERSGRLPPLQAVDYVLQACEALAAAHGRGIVHRDIKPENLFLTRQGELEILKLLDFGIAKAVLSGARGAPAETRRRFWGQPGPDEAASSMGTPQYMSPEQIHSLERVDVRSDIWSLGAVLYELITAQAAFSSADGVPALLDRICEAEPLPLVAYGSGPECDLQGVIDQCLDKNPARRFQNVAELAYALFPYASARSQLHAQRVASILGTGAAELSRSLTPPAPALATLESAHSDFGRYRDNSSGTRLRPPPAALATDARYLSEWSRGRRALRRAALASGALLMGALVFALFAAPISEPRSESLAAAAGAPVAASRVATEPPPSVPASRTVLVKSVPSGAVVKIEGQVMGITPLATLLPAGEVLVSLVKTGYAEAQQRIQVTPPGAELSPLEVRIALRALARQPSVRPQLATALPQSALPQSALPHSAAPATPSAATVASAPVLSQRTRLRLVEDATPVRRDP